MSAHLEDRVAAYVADHPGLTGDQIARGVCARTQSVREVLKSSLFVKRPRALSVADLAVVYYLGSAVPDGLAQPVRTPQEMTRGELFESKVEKMESGCWQWLGAIDIYGYGTFRFEHNDGEAKKGKAHRFAYSYYVGPIPDGLHLDHLCRNTACVNPDHLEPVPLAVNNQRGHTRKTPESDKQFLLRVLSDGEPHCLNEILRRSFADRGCGLTVHSRASDLRADGYRVENWKDGERGNGSWYRLTLGAGSGEAESALPAPSGQTPPELEGLTDSTSGCSTVDTESAASGAGDMAAESDGQLVLVGGAFGRRAAA